MTRAQFIMEVLLGDREAIRAAAIRFPDGTVYEGAIHAECWYEAYSKGKIQTDPAQGEFVTLIDEYGVEEGFTTTKGRFVGRSEAYSLSVSSGQRPPEAKTPGVFTDWLDSEDIYDRYTSA